MSSTWRTRPIFISSTFKDMQAERDWLQHHVFPRLEEELRKRRHHLEFIDLRIGVETTEIESEEGRELQVLKVCLDEISRSRPFLLVLLGDRYGWVPPKERIEVAAQEKGFETDLSNKSVTALEIEFGILKEHPDQKRCSLFFFRNPLPYESMPSDLAASYCDACSSDPSVKAGYEKLIALKDRLKNDDELGSHVFEYTADWDEVTQRVTGLEKFGNLVFEKLWEALDNETSEYLAQSASTWQEEEQAELEEFIEISSRDFTGREKIIQQILSFSLSPASENSVWGVCVTGLPGTGKSALFAKLYRNFSTNSNILLLSNAAGATRYGSRVDFMLRRWINQLSSYLNIENSLKEDSTAKEVNSFFSFLLEEVSQKIRVIVLLDALENMEFSNNSLFSTWRPKPWPINARVIVTADSSVPDWLHDASLEEIVLAPFTVQEAEQLSRLVWARYHRKPPVEALQVLTKKRKTDGDLSCGNPLWTLLANERLNLLLADDFERAEREEPDAPKEDWYHLVADKARGLSPDLKGLYNDILSLAETVHGSGKARVFASTIAVNPSGWREGDLSALLPDVSKTIDNNIDRVAWDTLSLADLRRAFRGQLIERGLERRWDFLHGQCREAALNRLEKEEDSKNTLEVIHRLAVDYLMDLPRDDKLRRENIMYHLMRAFEFDRAARLYSSDLDNDEIYYATTTLASHILSGEALIGPHPWVQMLILAEGVTEKERYLLCQRIVFELDPILEYHAQSRSRRRILDFVKDYLEDKIKREGTNDEAALLLANCYQNLSNLLINEGDIDSALVDLNVGLSFIKPIAAKSPDDFKIQDVFFSTLVGLGIAKMMQGDHRGALASFLSVQRHVTEVKPVVAKSLEIQLNHAISHLKAGQVFELEKDCFQALTEYETAITILTPLSKVTPSNPVFVRLLAIAREQSGVMLASLGRIDEAVKRCEKSLHKIKELYDAEPFNSERSYDLALSHHRMAQVCRESHKISDAFKHVSISIALLEPLALADSQNQPMLKDFMTMNHLRGECLLADYSLSDTIPLPEESEKSKDDISIHKDQCNTLAEWMRNLKNAALELKSNGETENTIKLFSILASLCLPVPDVGKNTGIVLGTQISALQYVLAQISELHSLDGDPLASLRVSQICFRLSERWASNHKEDEVSQAIHVMSCVHLAEQYIINNDLENAKKKYEHSIHLAEGSVPKARAISLLNNAVTSALIGLGNILILGGELEKAQSVCNRLQKICIEALNQEPNDLKRLNLAQALGQKAMLLIESGDHKGAVTTFREAIVLTTQLESTIDSPVLWTLQAKCHCSMGDLLLSMGDAEGARDEEMKAIAFFNKLKQVQPNNPLWVQSLAGALEICADARLVLNDYSDALEDRQSALAIYEAFAASEPSEPMWLKFVAESLNEISEMLEDSGQSFFSQGRFTEALNFFQKQEEICIQSNDLNGIQASWNNQACVYREIGKVEKAIEMHKKQEVLSREKKIPYGIALSLTNQVEILLEKMENVETALPLAEEALDIFKELNMADMVGHVMGLLKRITVKR